MEKKLYLQKDLFIGIVLHQTLFVVNRIIFMHVYVRHKTYRGSLEASDNSIYVF